MRSDRAALLRLALMCAGWAAGAVATHALGLRVLDPFPSAFAAAGVYAATGQLLAPPRRRDVRYWRGRPIDDTRWRR
ncbi:MAG: hypothetical protein M3O91_01390 [Chloroflexota bacterium]|nr:hypothetical protein [Chloroflexota bacterium]